MKKLLLCLLMFFSVAFAETTWKSGRGCVYNADTSTFVKADDLITDSGNYISKEYLFDSSSVNPICKSAEKAYYKIKYDSNYDGQHTVITSGELDYGVSYKLPKDVFTRTGYTLGYWCDSLECGTGRPYTTITGNCGSQGCEIYLYAQWSANSYNITYNLNGGNLSGQPKRSYTVETDYTLPTPTRTGYTFDGWYTTSGLTGTAVTKIAKGSTGDKTFYAKWKQSMPNKGDIIKLTNTLDMNKDGVVDTFRVLEVNGTQAKVMSMVNTGSLKFTSTLTKKTGIGSYLQYAGSNVDEAMTSYYNSLPSAIKNAIVKQNINQSIYSFSFSNGIKRLTGVNVGDRYIYALDMDDVNAYLGSASTPQDIVEMFWNQRSYIRIDTNTGIGSAWLRSAFSDRNEWQSIISAESGTVGAANIKFLREVRPAFVIDLSQTGYIIVR